MPVPEKLGNGKDPSRNLYWGAAYGIKSFFKNKTDDWQLVVTLETNNTHILERLLFRHKEKNVYLLADAYDGEKIKSCIEDFLKASNTLLPLTINHESHTFHFGSQSDLVAYCGHDGLMEFDVNINYQKEVNKRKDVIILACYSKEYFMPEIKKSGAHPVLWTTHLMAPEAYTLKWAIDGWLMKESGDEIKERAAQAYHQYQLCGIKGARNLFTSGF